MSYAKLADVHMNTAVVFSLTGFLASRPCYAQNPPLTALLSHMYTMFGLHVNVPATVVLSKPLFTSVGNHQTAERENMSDAVCYLFSKRAATRPSHNHAGLRS